MKLRNEYWKILLELCRLHVKPLCEPGRNAGPIKNRDASNHRMVHHRMAKTAKYGFKIQNWRTKKQPTKLL